MIYIAVLSNREITAEPLLQYSPCSLDPSMAATYRCISMKALARYQIILLGEQRHIGVNNLPKVVARQCISQESNNVMHCNLRRTILTQFNLCHKIDLNSIHPIQQLGLTISCQSCYRKGPTQRQSRLIC